LGDHLTIDLALIRSTGVGLGRIRDALQHAEATQSGVGVLGSGELAGAVDDFVDNWKIHRDKLVASVEAHQKMTTDSAEAYENTDEGLAKELTKPRSSGGVSPGTEVS